ncbi:unnamed protein product [Rhizoctonia solani]|uniref:RlpA-like protein double-psi beta-barrel domain-containing protein n=1 Tax=Rhizoctonia solani TaxID=456999 RepID=A0A8H2XK99_9AGAM|nr:unnamed protein product [Rhizoctonia solani]CAE6501101.1 unnamed protein product [Rhizoctonia solani]
MRFTLPSVVVTLLGTSSFALAAPTTSDELVHAVSPPTGVKLYDTMHGLPDDNKLHKPSTQPDLQVRQGQSGTGYMYEPGLGACGRTPSSSEPVVAISRRVYSQNMCGRTISIQSNGRRATGTIFDICDHCGQGDLDMSPALFRRFTSSNNPIPVTWQWA